MTEPHRFTSILTCLTSVTRQIVLQTPNFPQGQTYVLSLLMSVLPGIDSNDLDKTIVTFAFLKAMLMVITCVDCSSAVDTRKDLTEVRQICTYLDQTK
jgi:proteasome activator subunit 4